MTIPEKTEIEKAESIQLKPVMPLMTAMEAKQAWQKYEDLKNAVLDNQDYQAIAGKRYIKRSGFRKIAVFFGVSDRILSEERIDREDQSFVWRIKVEVAAPNGRITIGVGACDSRERGFAHLEHDVYATAHTRAKSRAISDLVAGGALSAEEIEAEETQPKNKPVDVTPYPVNTFIVKSDQPKVESSWQPIPIGAKGPWEKNDDLSDVELQAVIAEMDQAERSMIEKDGYLYWQLLNDSKILIGLGRRKKT